jgi:hypothetical protein
MNDFSKIYKEDKLIKHDFFSYIRMSLVRVSFSDNKKTKWLALWIFDNGAHINNFAGYLKTVFFSFRRRDATFIIDEEPLLSLVLYPRAFSRRVVTYAALYTGLVFDPPLTKAMSYAKDYANVKTDEEREAFFKKLTNDFLDYLLKRENILATCTKVESHGRYLWLVFYIQTGSSVMKNVVSFESTGLLHDIPDVIEEVARKVLCVKYTKLEDFNTKVKRHVESFLEIAFPTRPIAKVKVYE